MICEKDRFRVLAVSLAFCLLAQVSQAMADNGVAGAGTLLKEAVALQEEGKLDKALEVITEALKADAANPGAHDRAGHILLEMGRPDEAMKEFNSALALNPRERTSKTGLGLALFRKGDLKGAEAALTEALTLNPYPSTTHYALGLVYEKQGDFPKAIEHFKEGIKKYRSGKR